MMVDDQVSHIIAVIKSEMQLKDHSTGFFHQVKNFLQSLKNVVLEKVL